MKREDSPSSRPKHSQYSVAGTWSMGFSDGSACKESTCQYSRYKRYGLHPWVGKNPWRRKWKPTLVFLPEKTPWTEERSGLQSKGSQWVSHDWATQPSTQVVNKGDQEWMSSQMEGECSILPEQGNVTEDQKWRCLKPKEVVIYTKSCWEINLTTSGSLEP